MSRLDEIRARLEAVKAPIALCPPPWTPQENMPVEFEGCDVWPFHCEEARDLTMHAPDDIEWLLEAVRLAEIMYEANSVSGEAGVPSPAMIDAKMAYRTHVEQETPNARMAE